jgi:hypothetical protein
MASFTFTLPGTTKSFTIKGPDGFSEAQARAIFDQQAAAGSFVGFKPGDALSAAKQAASGLSGAASQLAQSLAGTTSIVNGAVLNNVVGQAAGQVSQAVGQATSVAKQAISTVTGIISKVPVTDGINPADFAKQASALVPMGNLTSVDVRAGLAQASKLVGQAASVVSNTAGVGKFGFDGAQLESAGILKPGVAAQYLQSGVNKLTDVLKSPTVFTGKDGIKSLTDLLGSESKQNGIQQDLMAKGLDGLKQVGIPTDSLNPAALVGTALNAAKSLPATVDWAKGLPLPGDLKSKFDAVARDGAFAVDFANQKVNNALKQEIVPEPASDTVNRETVNAAASRVVGNAKVPAVSYNSTPRTATSGELAGTVAQLTAQLDNLLDRGIAIMSKTDQQRRETNSYSRDIRALELVIADLNQTSGQALTLKRTADALDPPNTAVVSQAEQLISKIEQAIKQILSAIATLRQNISNLTA